VAREGWDCKSGAAVLGIHPCKFTTAADPAFTKVARLMMADPYRTHVELLRAMARVEAELLDRETDARAAMLDGRPIHATPRA